MPEKHWGTNSVPPDVATRNARPHTAHGLRESDIPKGRGEAAPVVAGARGMMRYPFPYMWRIVSELRGTLLSTPWWSKLRGY